MEFLKSRLASQVFKCALLILFTGMLHSCQHGGRSNYVNEMASVSIPGLPFNIEQGLFLNQYVNPSSRTTSWVLADSSFIHDQLLADFFTGNGKGKLCILHWSQANDPVWIGARIPARFLWVDLLMYESDTLVIRQYKRNGAVVTVNESYRKEIEGLLKEVIPVSYP